MKANFLHKWVVFCQKILSANMNCVAQQLNITHFIHYCRRNFSKCPPVIINLNTFRLCCFLITILFYFTWGWSVKCHKHLFPFNTVSFHDCCFFKMDSLKSSSNKRLTKNPVFMFSSSSKSFGAGFGLSDTSSHFSKENLIKYKTFKSLSH